MLAVPSVAVLLTQALGELPGVLLPAAPLRGADALALTPTGIVVLTVAPAGAGADKLAAVVDLLHGAAAAVAVRVGAAGMALPDPTAVLIVPDGAPAPVAAAGSADVLIVPAAAAAAVLRARTEAVLVAFNTARGVYPNDTHALDATVAAAVADAVGVQVALPGAAELAAAGLGAGGTLHDADASNAQLLAALAAAAPSSDVLTDSTDAVRARARHDLAGTVTRRLAAVSTELAVLTELVYADTDADESGVGAFAHVGGVELYVPAQTSAPIQLAWTDTLGMHLGVTGKVVQTEADLAAAPRTQAPAAQMGVDELPRVRIGQLSARIVEPVRLARTARAMFTSRLGLDVADEVDLTVKSGRDGEQLVWAEAALGLGSARLAYTEYYTHSAWMPAPKSARLELVSSRDGQPTLARVRNREELLAALAAVRPAPDVTALGALAEQLPAAGPRRLFGRRR